ncbi:MAG: 1,4-alpha-glucan branching protein GlgB [Steroidobacteraceae bacterium]
MRRDLIPSITDRGPHRTSDDRTIIRVFQPDAKTLELLDPAGYRSLGFFTPLHPEGSFEITVDGNLADYRLRATWADGATWEFDDPYRHATSISETDLWLFSEGTLLRPHEVLGAQLIHSQGISGTRFAVWAPKATAVCVVGDFNFWDERRHPMRPRGKSGVWELFIPGVGDGALYKFALRDRRSRRVTQKSDPFARRVELRPSNASIVSAALSPIDHHPTSQQRNQFNQPISIYEVHAGSWRYSRKNGRRFADWDELIDTLIPYVKGLGFTHLELLPITEYPLDESWGYQPTGLYAPTSRHGSADDFRRFVAACHDEGLGVIVDWVPAHFPSDAHGLARFDGSALYEYADPREGKHPDWNTLIYDFNKPQVRNFLLGSALYWLEYFDVDGLRVDAVASMLYRDYSRRHGEWLPNKHGGKENLEAIGFLRQLNELVGKHRSGAIVIAEESTAFPQVTHPTYLGGLGFHYKWNMGWMNDTLRYMAREPIHRRHHHNELTFNISYAYSENFILPISHDEVVHGKGSLLGRMRGTRQQKFSNLRAYLGFMFAHPGKKLLFMGSEFAQEREWNHSTELDWHLLDHDLHLGTQRLIRDLNTLLGKLPTLHQLDHDRAGFEWLDVNNHQQSLIAFCRRSADPESALIVICNFTPAAREGYRVGVPLAGIYEECLNTDSEYYGGGNVGTPLGLAHAEKKSAHGKTHSIVVRVPPLATIFLTRRTPVISKPVE